MTTDFSYGNKAIDSSGPIKPSGKNQPLDPRTEVKIYADIETIPNPYVGMIITVLEDETNQNKMTDYKVLSLKANALGIANSVIDRVQRYVEYLGVSTGGSSSSGTGLTSEQEEKLNKIPEMETSINNINESLNTKANTSDIPTKTSKLTNDSGFLTSIPSEYVTETEMNEAIANASTGYATKDELNTKANTSDIPTKVSELYNDSYFVTTSQLNTAISGIQNTNAATIPILPNIVLFGDSITDTKVNGEWVKQIINYAKFNSLTNYGRGYCTFTFKNDTVKNTTNTGDTNTGDNVIWNQYNRMVEDINNRKIPSPDCIIILAGTNDAIQTKTIGEVDSVFNNSAQSTDVKTLTNLCASVRYVCELIMVNYPNTQIILATPLQMKDYNRTSQAILVRNAIISCANKMGIKTIDQTYESGIYAYAENVRPKFLSDGVHLTVEGGKKVAQFLAREFYNKININYYKKETEETITLSSISATFNQGSNKIYNTDSLDTLKNYLTVTATYSNNSTKTVTDYTLSGTLSIGVSTITVTYSNKTATFNVTVSEVETPTTTYTITNNLTNVVTNNPSASVTEGNSYVATLTANSGYTLDNVTVTMAGTNITSSCYSDGSINISNVTGNIIITASAIKTTTEEAVKYFRDEYISHIKDKKCPAGVCTALKTYTINPDLCRGCSKCARNCPAEAIHGELKSPYKIDQSKCIRCGACVSGCPFKAIEQS